MKKLLISSFFAATFALFTACGDDVTEVTEVNEIYQSGIAVLDAGLELSKQKCDTTDVGEMLFVTDSSEVFVCDGKNWLTLKGADGTDGDDGDDGKNCEVSREGNELTIICANSTETINLDDIIQSSSSSSVVFPEGVMSAGYYENHCPAGHTCKDAAPTTYLKAGITYGEILDTRDDQVYKVVTIGTQTWMAQNLNYAPDENHVHSLGDYAWSGCYGEGGDDYASEGYLSDSQVAANCSKYGRLYTWEVAMDKAGCGYGESCNNSYEGSQGICPEGWHLPTYAEWDTLFTNVVGENVAGRMLKSEEGWNYYLSTTGIDYYGFSAPPAGFRHYDGDFYGAGEKANFWSSGEGSSYNAYYMYLNYNYEHATLNYLNKNYAFSVRCLLNN